MPPKPNSNQTHQQTNNYPTKTHPIYKMTGRQENQHYTSKLLREQGEGVRGPFLRFYKEGRELRFYSCGERGWLSSKNLKYVISRISSSISSIIDRQRKLALSMQENFDEENAADKFSSLVRERRALEWWKNNAEEQLKVQIPFEEKQNARARLDRQKEIKKEMQKLEEEMEQLNFGNKIKVWIHPTKVIDRPLGLDLVETGLKHLPIQVTGVEVDEKSDIRVGDYLLTLRGKKIKTVEQAIATFRESVLTPGGESWRYSRYHIPGAECIIIRPDRWGEGPVYNADNEMVGTYENGEVVCLSEQVRTESAFPFNTTTGKCFKAETAEYFAMCDNETFPNPKPEELGDIPLYNGEGELVGTYDVKTRQLFRYQ